MSPWVFVWLIFLIWIQHTRSTFETFATCIIIIRFLTNYLQLRTLRYIKHTIIIYYDVTYCKLNKFSSLYIVIRKHDCISTVIKFETTKSGHNLFLDPILSNINFNLTMLWPSYGHIPNFYTSELALYVNLIIIIIHIIIKICSIYYVLFSF